MAASGHLSHQPVGPAVRRSAVALCAAVVLLALAAGVAAAQQAEPTAVVTVGARPVEVIRTPMPLSTILIIALVAAAASAVNGLVGAILLFVIWMWLYGGAIPSIWLYLREPAEHSWTPHLLLPLIVFLLVWQYRLRGKIGPSWGLRDVIERLMARRNRQSLA